jgi:CHAD domain-containing protein
MGYGLLQEETITNGMVRVISETCALAAESLERPENAWNESIHECRKQLKKARAAVRLASSAFPDKAARHECRALRDIARLSASFREQCAHMECIETLLKTMEEQEPQHLLTSLRNSLDWKGNQKKPSLKRNSWITESHSRILEVSSRLKTYNWVEMDKGHLKKAITHSYQKNRKAFRRIRKNPTTENFHEWRKRAKDLRYQMTMLAQAWPAFMEMQEREFHRLTDLLGQAHDWALLETLVRENNALALSPAERSALKDIIARSQTTHYEAALTLGRLLYAETSSAFSKRWGCYIDAWFQ